MKLVSKILFHLLSNILALLAASYVVAGFNVNRGIRNIIVAGLIFTLLNMLVRPVLKLILGPLIIITLGLGIIAVNAIILYIFTRLSPDVAVSGLIPLVYATLIISLTNIVVHFLVKGIS